MVKVNVTYLGDLHTEAVHVPTGEKLYTDAPVENQGLGRTFSPTDLLCVALGSCVATVLGIYAKRKQWDLKGMKIDVEKIMHDTPYRHIGKLIVQIWMPLALETSEQEKVRSVAHSCPVHKSLHPDIEVEWIFHWKVPVIG